MHPHFESCHLCGGSNVDTTSISANAVEHLERVRAMVASRNASECAYSALGFANECIHKTVRTIRVTQQSLDAKGVALDVAKEASRDATVAYGMFLFKFFVF